MKSEDCTQFIWSVASPNKMNFKRPSSTWGHAKQFHSLAQFEFNCFPAPFYLNFSRHNLFKFFPAILYLNYYNITCVTGTPFIRWSIVIYCLISRAISFACSVWIRVIRCCIKLPHFISRNSVPSSVWTFLVEIT